MRYKVILIAWYAWFAVLLGTVAYFLSG